MDELSKYERDLLRQLDNLPVPDGQSAWEEIAASLDKEEKRGIVPPGAERNNSFRKYLWGLLLLVGLTAFGIYVFNLDRSSDNKLKVMPGENKPLISAEHSKQPVPGQKIIANASAPTGNTTLKRSPGDKGLSTLPTAQQNAVTGVNTGIESAVTKNKLQQIAKIPGQSQNKKKPKKTGKTKFGRSSSMGLDVSNADIGDNVNENMIVDSDNKIKNSNAQIQNDTVIKQDSVGDKPFPVNDTLADNKNAAAIQVKKKDKEKKQTAWAVGLALQQGFGINCHTSFNDTKFTDYLPSVYARWYASDKLFIQAEYKYSAPVYLDEFLYERVIQSKHLNHYTTNYILTKVHYHQLPFSINYFIAPHLSAGIGIRCNLFSTATSRIEERKILYGQATDSLISSKVVTDKNDSGFVAFHNYLQALFELQYKWKRISVGARCAFGLQPYVDYYEPYLNVPGDKSSSSIELFLRYELWRNRKQQ